MSITFRTSDRVDGEINMSNGNAWLVMQAAGIGPDYCGTLEPGDIPAVLRTIMARLNGDVSAFTRPPVREEYVGRSAQGNVVEVHRRLFVDQGIDVEYVRGRLRQLQAILMNARRGGRAVSWG